MTRLLVFEGPRAPRRFELLWTALMQGGVDKDGQGDRSPGVIRKEARLQELLEHVSEPSPNGADPTRTLVNTPTLTLQQEDFDLLQQYTEKTRWTPRVAKDAVDLWDWLSTAEKHD